MQEVVSNYMAHGSDIMTNIAKEKQDWATGSYYDAGKDTAIVINFLIPFQNNEMATIIADSYKQTKAIDLAAVGTETTLWDTAKAIG